MEIGSNTLLVRVGGDEYPPGGGCVEMNTLLGRTGGEDSDLLIRMSICSNNGWLRTGVMLASCGGMIGFAWWVRV